MIYQWSVVSSDGVSFCYLRWLALLQPNQHARIFSGFRLRI
jgi:hypothetical protein